MNIFNLFRKDDKQIADLTTKISELEKQVIATVDKSALNTSLAGIVGNNWIDLNINANQNLYTQHYTVYRGINMMADCVSQLPIQIYRGDVLMPDDFIFPNGFSLQTPHPKMSLNELLYTSCIHLFYDGEFMWYIDLEGFMTIEPVNPKFMTLEQNGNWKYNYKKIIPPEQLIYSKFYNPDINPNISFNNDRGLSVVDVLRKEIANDISARDYAIKYFENYAQLGGIIYDETGKVTKETMQMAMDSYNAMHANKSNAWKTAAIGGGLKLQQQAQTMTEMQFLESRKDIRDRVLSTLGIHKALFGITDHVTKAETSDALYQLWLLNLRPNAIRIQEKLNQQLFNKYFPGYKCYFDFNGIDVLSEDESKKIEKAKGLRDLGYTLNEINEYLDLGMDDITDPIGSMRFVPTSLIPIDEMISPLEFSPPAPTKSIDSIFDKAVSLLDQEEKTFCITKSQHTYIRNFKRLQRITEKQFTGKLSKYFATQLNKVMDAIGNSKSINKTVDLNTLLSIIHNTINNDKGRLEATTKQLYEEAYKDADILAIAVTGSDKPYNVDDIIVSQLSNEITKINNTIYNTIRNELKTALDAGESIDEMTNRIKDVYKFSTSRARIIARTETGKVLNRSTDKRYTEEGVKKKRWLSAGDGVVRPTHAENNSKGIVQYDTVYPNGLRFPGDVGSASEIVDCRCVLLPIISED